MLMFASDKSTRVYSREVFFRALYSILIYFLVHGCYGRCLPISWASFGMRQAPDKPEELRIEFSKGVPVKVCRCLLHAAVTLTCYVLVYVIYLVDIDG